MSVNQKMSTEEAIEAAYKVLENVGNTLEKFIEGKLGGAGTQSSDSSVNTGSGLYSRYSDSPTLSTKQELYAENLVLTKGALEDVKKIMEESVRSTPTLR